MFFSAASPFVEAVDDGPDIVRTARPGNCSSNCFRRQAERLLDDVGRGPDLGERVHHLDQLVRAPAALDVVADAARLIVRDQDLLRVFWPDESPVELRDRQELLLLEGDDDVRCEAVAPPGVGLSLLVNRQAFGEPARHAVVGGGEDEDVVHLVPERAAPS